MIYVYRQASKSATALADAIKDEGCEVVRWKDLASYTPKKSDLIINWGACVNFPGSAEVLNRHLLGDKLRELKKIRAAGIPAPRVESYRPSTGTWLARKCMHHEADDIRANLEMGDYYTERLPINKEFRFHVFKGKVIQTQFKKAVKDDAHPWIRCWATGWDWKNGSEGATTGMQGAAIKAVEACGYDFGAVDVGRLPEGEFVVLEVNTAPGFDVGGTTCYKWANAIIAAAKD